MGRTLPDESEFNSDWDHPPWLLSLTKDVLHSSIAARRYILDRLKSGEYIAAGRVNRRLTLITETLWETWDDQGDSHFWTAGDATFYVATDHTGYNQRAVRYLGVRINSNPDSDAPKQIGGNAEAPIPLKKAALSVAEARAWHGALPAHEQSLGLRKLWDKAKNDHPGMRVVRKVIEPIVEGRKTGRPAKS